MDENPYKAPKRGILSFTIRDLMWVTVVVGVAFGWWADQDRIRRQSEALKAAAQRLQALPVRAAQTKLHVAEAELDQLNEINQRNPGVISESELRRAELGLDIAKIDLEKARAKEEYGAATNPPTGQN